MSQRTDLRMLTLAGIAHRCQHETERFFQGQGYDPLYCFDLFRRAIMERSQRAWELVYEQYRPLVAGWVERHSAFPGSGEEIQYFVNRAFEKMWLALTPAKFTHFSNLGSLLRYLQMCVHSVILDQVRAAQRCTYLMRAESWPAERGADDPLAEDQALDRVHSQELWQEIGARLRNEKERRVMYGSFVLALKPRELYALFRETFHDVRDVYRVKENVLARLRRDAELLEFLGRDTRKTPDFIV